MTTLQAELRRLTETSSAAQYEHCKRIGIAMAKMLKRDLNNPDSKLRVLMLERAKIGRGFLEVEDYQPFYPLRQQAENCGYSPSYAFEEKLKDLENRGKLNGVRISPGLFQKPWCRTSNRPFSSYRYPFFVEW